MYRCAHSCHDNRNKRRRHVRTHFVFNSKLPAFVYSSSVKFVIWIDTQHIHMHAEYIQRKIRKWSNLGFAYDYKGEEDNLRKNKFTASIVTLRQQSDLFSARVIFSFIYKSNITVKMHTVYFLSIWYSLYSPWFHKVSRMVLTCHNS